MNSDYGGWHWDVYGVELICKVLQVAYGSPRFLSASTELLADKLSLAPGKERF